MAASGWGKVDAAIARALTPGPGANPLLDPVVHAALAAQLWPLPARRGLLDSLARLERLAGADDVSGSAETRAMLVLALRGFEAVAAAVGDPGTAALAAGLAGSLAM